MEHRRAVAGGPGGQVEGVVAASEQPAAALVVIVAATRAEQQRLLASVPEDVAVLLAPTRERAEELLHTLPPAPAAALERPPLTVVADERVVCIGDQRVRLTPLEFAMLRVLTSDPAHVWSFAELSRQVWTTGYVGDGAQVRAVVKRLRRKLSDADAPVVIETVRGAGFCLRPRPEGSAAARAQGPSDPA